MVDKMDSEVVDKMDSEVVDKMDSEVGSVVYGVWMV